MYKMYRLPFGASCSPFIAIQTVRQIIECAGDEKMTSVVHEMDLRRRLFEFGSDLGGSRAISVHNEGEIGRGRSESTKLGLTPKKL